MTEIRRWSVLVNAGYSSKLSRLCGPMRAEGAAAIVDLAKVSSEFSLLTLSRGNVLMRLNDFTPWQEARHGLNRNLKALRFTTLLVALREFRYGSRLCDTRPGSSTDLGLFNRDFRFLPRERTSSVSRTTSEKGQERRLMRCNKFGPSKLVVSRAARRATPWPASDRACRSLR
jgi:hypothetical protein